MQIGTNHRLLTRAALSHIQSRDRKGAVAKGQISILRRKATQ